MSIPGILMALVLVALSVAIVALPLLRANSSRSREALARKAHDEILTAYERVLTTIRDLDEDFQTGKLQETEYQEERTRRVQQGAVLLQQLEVLDASQVWQGGVETPAAAAVDDAAVEALIARYAQQKG
jgi:hypothetical protein